MRGGILLLILSGLLAVGSAVAQNKSQAELDAAEAAREAKARSDARAFEANRNATNAADAARRRSDELELDALRKSAPARAAAVTAEANERNAALKAQDNLLESMQAQTEHRAHVEAKREELEAFLRNPPPPPVPGSYTECDELASAPFDNTRPLGINGVAAGEMKTGAAIASCREELTKHPGSVRTAFELGRALVTAGRCDEGVPALQNAIAKGSAAAAVSYALLVQGLCKSAAVTGNMEKYLKMASDMGSGDGAWILGQLYFEAGKHVPSGSDASKELWNAEKAAYWRAFKLVDDRAVKGDLDALFIEAYLAHYTGSMIMGRDSIKAQYRCVVRGYAPCMEFDATGVR